MRKSLLAGLLSIVVLSAQQTVAPDPGLKDQGLKDRPAPAPGSYQVEPGTRILLSMINSVSTKQSVVGDRIYLETAFPILINGKMVVPRGSWVTGTVTEVTRPKRGIKGNGEIAVRFDSLTLPNGVSRSFRGDLGALDASNEGKLDHETGKVSGPNMDKKEAVRTVAITTAAGAGVGTAVGAAAGHIRSGSVIGVAGGAAAGLVSVLASRRPDAVLQRGMTVEMVLDRPLYFNPDELAGVSDGSRPR